MQSVLNFEIRQIGKMLGVKAFPVVPLNAPVGWAARPGLQDSSLHQLSPYIGKLKPLIARDLITQYSKAGDLVVDPFCGSGTIPLEAALLGRTAFASDDSSYAYVLTMAKLRPPPNEFAALKKLDLVLNASERRSFPDLRQVPKWVRQFFHPQTLRNAIRFADECLDRHEMFLLACFLGVLHHQRPGFLSYPSSHLVPYLRARKFPRAEYPEMYEPREIRPRMTAKIRRAYARLSIVQESASAMVRKSRIEHLSIPRLSDAIITSPPYMNALDYQRDNRLRLWFLDRSIGSYFPEPTDKRAAFERMIRQLLNKASLSLKKGKHLVLVVGETITRKRITSHPSSTVLDLVEQGASFRLVEMIRDVIPDVRRSRRDCRGTKTEHVLVFRRR